MGTDNENPVFANEINVLQLGGAEKKSNKI